VNGPQHYAEGDRLMDRASEEPPGSVTRDQLVAEAQANYTAALVAATVNVDRHPEGRPLVEQPNTFGGAVETLTWQEVTR
jgi:hypothetical protein